MSADKLPAALLEQATDPYRPLGKFAWHFARGKLGGDPVFAGLLRRGLIPAGARVLDIGCGQGLLAALLGSLSGDSSAERAWPPGWAPPPAGARVHGIELMPRDVERAQGALAPLGDRARFTLGDMCSTDFGQADVVVILDVLHYVSHEAQEDVLRRVRDALTPGGALLLRVGDAAAGLPFRISNWVDAIVTFARGHRLSRLYCRPLSQWQEQLQALGFSVQAIPMHEGTPFANILLVARRPDGATS
ncbi:MAG: class I SAM-dependent methyltransferase [Hylemonella sp.]|nr:class I SAM-dependent methyltransferase [Hylemonella sp.]